MSYLSVSSNEFLQTAKNWIESNGEILVLFRYHAGAGSKDWEFYNNYESFEKKASELKAKTQLLIFEKNSFNLRGTVNDKFLRRAIKYIEDVPEWMIIGLEKVKHGAISWVEFEIGNTKEELVNVLKDEHFWERYVALGIEPEWWVEDHRGLLTGIVPNSNGKVEVGIY